MPDTWRCDECGEEVSYDDTDPDDAHHDLVPFDSDTYRAWVDEALHRASDGSDIYDTWSEHTGTTSNVAREYWDLLAEKHCRTQAGRGGAHYADRFNDQYAGGRGDLYHS